MLKVRHFEVSCQILVHFGFHESYTFQKVGQVAIRGRKVKCTYKEQLEDQLQLIRSIGNMIGYKKSLSEWQ